MLNKFQTDLNKSRKLGSKDKQKRKTKPDRKAEKELAKKRVEWIQQAPSKEEQTQRFNQTIMSILHGR